MTIGLCHKFSKLDGSFHLKKIADLPSLFGPSDVETQLVAGPGGILES